MKTWEVLFEWDVDEWPKEDDEPIEFKSNLKKEDVYLEVCDQYEGDIMVDLDGDVFEIFIRQKGSLEWTRHVIEITMQPTFYCIDTQEES